MNLNHHQLAIIIGGVCLALAIFGVVAFNLRSSTRPAPVALTVWGVFDLPDVFNTVAGGYQALHPNVKITYQRYDATGYRDAVLNALAAGQGPDIVTIHNRSLPRDIGKLAPAPSTIMSGVRLRELYPTVVEQDFLGRDGAVYALPQSIDTLALFYNRDMFDNAGIVSPPATWDEFQNDVAKLRVVNAQGQIVTAGAAIGSTEKTVNAGVDILHLLMLQGGVAMVDTGDTSATFSPGAGDAGIAAFAFYLQFANPASSVYTWSDAQTSSLESFAAGKVAMIFGYKRDEDALRGQSPYFRFGIAPVPQRAGSNLAVSYADYWGYAVSKQSRAQATAWDFVNYLATDPGATAAYTNATFRPPALRTLIGQTENDASLGVFVKQSLTARSWYEADDDKIRSLFNTAIDQVLRGARGPHQALREAQDQVSQLMR